MDIYDEAVQWLTEHQGDIPDAWEIPFGFRGGVLFALAAGVEEQRLLVNGGPFSCGCLTQVKSGSKVAETIYLTDLIRVHPDIPLSYGSVTEENLHVFAEMQRMMDDMFPGRREFMVGHAM